MNAHRLFSPMKRPLLTAALIASGFAFSAMAQAADAPADSPAPAAQAKATKKEIMVKHVTPEYWRVTLHNPG